jgi:hypothetical protein
MMLRFLPLALLWLGAAPAAAETRNFGVSGFERIRLEGPFRVTVTTGKPPSASASGASAAALQNVSLELVGKTLVIRSNRSAWGGYPGEQSGPIDVRISTHELSAVWLNGSGSIAIDRVRGLAFDASAQGSGLLTIAEASVDQLKVRLNGSASARVGGSAHALNATLRGTSTLDAGELTVKDATLAGDGSVTIRATVTNSAKIDAEGTAAMTIAGNPGCAIRAVGSASVSGCR